MISDRQAALLSLDIYAAAPQFDFWSSGLDGSEVCFGIKRIGNDAALIFRGTADLEDWLSDFDHFGLAQKTPYGDIHPGFYKGMEIAVPKAIEFLKSDVPDNLLVGGHSLGAARADIAVEMLTAAGITVNRRVVFGEPKPAIGAFNVGVAKVSGVSYRNVVSPHHDLITDVPFTFPPEDYGRPTPVVDVSAAAPPNDPWGIFALHHMELYVTALSLPSPA